MKQIIPMLSLVGMLAAGIWAFDGHYARSADVERRFGEFKQLYLASELRALKKDLFELEITQERRPLTRLERQRMRQVQGEIKRLEGRSK